METVRSRMTGEDRRRLILDTAMALFAENGFEKTSTKQLAKAAHCSEALLYKYFDSKEAIMNRLLEEWRQIQNQETKLELINGSAYETLRSHYESYFMLKDSKPGKEKILADALNSTPYYRRKAHEIFISGSDMVQNTIIPLIRQGQLQGEIKAGNPTEMANLFIGYMVGVKEMRQNFPQKVSPLSFDVLAQMIF